ncbi:hypothetical protein N4G70_29170 [Streptomyces sp. ASQP_92]|uniref:zinc finger domain-containing protein n=1 Tax=Streptomyces sp. ASQP_92 TaxID=2979116 RepID=UPI0021C20FB4|nr:hypothetical protein [Streptomyces sp. ASQP_92]MCT9092913.1 hypothetical protein [Streptomyces sp. ASQP_92]
MNVPEAAELLSHCTAFDNRQPSEAAAIAWASALHDVPFDTDAKAAVASYYTTPPQNPNERLWILPHHVRTLRTKIRNQRLENFQYEPQPDETIAEYLGRLRGQVKAIASGRIAGPSGQPMLSGGPSKRFIEELEARGFAVGRDVPDSDEESLVDTVRRSGPLGVKCPACAAEIGFPCNNGRATAKHPLGKPLPKPHTARSRAASGETGLSAEQRAAEEQRVREASRRALERLEAEQAIHDAEIVDEEVPRG